MNIAITHTRLHCLDGVSLEAEKWGEIYESLGHNIFFIAGKIGEKKKNSLEIPEGDYLNPEIKKLRKKVFSKKLSSSEKKKILKKIYYYSNIIKPKIKKFIIKNKIKLLSVENIFSLPFNIPFTIAVADVMEELNLPCIVRHHDFYWERKSIFKNTKNVRDILHKYFPPRKKNMIHVTINKKGQSSLKKFKNIKSKLIYNHFDAKNIQKDDSFNANLRKDLKINNNSIVFLQPTRIVERKQIEISIHLVAAIQKRLNKKCVLLITGPPDEDLAYTRKLERLAKKLKVKIVYGYKRVHIKRKRDKRNKIYSIKDIYRKLDIVTLPSSIEGFGNAVIESSLNQKPLFVNRYPVLNEILKFGFDFIVIDNKLTKKVIDDTYEILMDKQKMKSMVENNFEVAKKYFSLEHLRKDLSKVLNQLL